MRLTDEPPTYWPIGGHRVHFRRLSVLACVSLVAIVSCAQPKTFVTVRPTISERQDQTVNPIQVADAAIGRAQTIWFLAAVSMREHNPHRLTRGTSRPAPAVAPTLGSRAGTAATLDWNCVSRVETGNDFTMHGSDYSSAYGVMNEAVRENASPAVAARILAGTASAGEQLRMAESVAARHGIAAWAAGTVADCAVK